MRKFKIGDIIVLIKGDSHYMDDLIGIPCEVTGIENDKILHSNMGDFKYFLPVDNFVVISKEVYNSPLYQAMRENE